MMLESSDRLAALSPAKRLLLEQRLAQQQSPAANEPIAVVGMACRFPGARNVDDFWRIIRDGIDTTGDVPASRWDLNEFYDATGKTPGKMSVRWGGFVDDVDQFDPSFFGITPREASRMDPQQRLLLETAWQAFEHAGISPEASAGSKTGVFVGIGGADYAKIPSQFANYYEYIDAHVGTGNALSIAANRISYIFDFHGPSFAVDTACSSGLVALHAAMQSLRNRECDAALAGAANLILSPEVTIAFSKAHMLSPNGRCRPFDAKADGYVRGEGCGLLLVKRLSDAVRSGDRILGVLRGIAVNQDGRTSGITAPNGLSQQEVIRAAWAQAKLTPDRIQYIEAHGTGTPLGDPIEMQALAKLFPAGATIPSVAAECFVSSVKANIGHTETVSGIAGLIKVLLMMQHESIPAQLHLDAINPYIKLEETRLRVPTKPLPWRRGPTPRIAGVSSFGFGGTNVHLIVSDVAEDSPATFARSPQSTPATSISASNGDRSSQRRSAQIFVWSAKSEQALTETAASYAAALAANPDVALADFCASAAVGRSHFPFRAATVVGDVATLRDRLAKFAAGEIVREIRSGQAKAGRRPNIAFMFTGQGSQYENMAQGLYESDPRFRALLDEASALLGTDLRRPLLNVLFQHNGDTGLVNETEFTQPALFTLEYALARRLQDWGLTPDIVLGHSVGEYAAACVAGVFSFADGLRLIAERARLMQSLPAGGAMAAVFAPRSDVVDVLASQPAVVVAASNGPANTVISGPSAAVAGVLELLTKRGIGSQRLQVSHAFHSALMDPILHRFTQFATTISYQAPQIPLVSNLDAETMAAAPDADYWRRHLRSEVRFLASAERMLATSPAAVVEIGPSPQLTGMVKGLETAKSAVWLSTLRRNQDDFKSLFASLAELYVLGANVRWSAVFDAGENRHVPLPGYPFQRSSHWFETGERRDGSSGLLSTPVHPLLGGKLSAAVDAQVFETRLTVNTPSYLADHRVESSVVVPAAAYLELAAAAARDRFQTAKVVIENLSVVQPLFLADDAPRRVQTCLGAESGGEVPLGIHSRAPENDATSLSWTKHAGATLRASSEAEPPAMPEAEDVIEQAIDARSRDEFYRLIAARGLEYGPAFQVLSHVYRTADAAVCDVALPESVAGELSRYVLHPTLLDGCMQAMAAIVPVERNGDYSPFGYLPVQIGRMHVVGRPTAKMRIVATRTSTSQPGASPAHVEGNLMLLDERGALVATFERVRVQRFGGVNTGAAREELVYQVVWEPMERGDAPTAKKTTATMLILADKGGCGEALAAQWQARGGRSIVVTSAQLADADFTEVMDRATTEAAGEGAAPWEHVVDLRALDVGFDAQPAAESPALAALELVQYLSRQATRSTPRLRLVTRGAVAIDGSPAAVSPEAATVWGFGRVAAVEHPELHCRLLDLDPSAPDVASASTAATLLQYENDEDEIALRNDICFKSRLKAAPKLIAESDDSTTETPPSGPYRVRLARAGDFEGLRFEPISPTTPPPGHVSLAVHATGLNFSDVLKAMGLYPGLTETVVPLGIECAGIVTAVGDGVSRFKVGDRVLGVAPHAFATHATTTEYALAHLPESLSMEEGATIPIVFLTAHYALLWMGRLQKDERVLIHAGAGGVGLAALQVARAVGAEVFATTGSDEKRAFLRAQGIAHVFSSRNLEFAEQVLQATDRRGVDVVLNSLPGEAITKSLEVLAAYGRFLEIGKTDIYQNRAIGLLPFQDNLSYSAIDLDRMLRQRPREIERLFAEVMERFESGEYRPIPRTTFPATDVRDAFRYMAQRKNTGKVVVTMIAQTEAADLPKPAVHGDATYLITGGLGALGLQLAVWLADRGAKHLALLARRPNRESVAATLNGLEARGAQVIVLQGDVADRGSLRAALKGLAELPPLEGVFHAAGVLDDGLIFDMTASRMQQVFAPKLLGAWNLHEQTRDSELRHFVLFSSVAALLGSPGQANYAAANAYLDAFAAWRRSQGLVAASINWGPWAGAGMATGGTLAEGLSERGMELLDPATALSLLGGLLNGDVAQAAIVNAHWPELTRRYRRLPSLLRELAASHSDDAAATPASADPLVAELQQADLPTRRTKLVDFFLSQLAKIMGLDPTTVDVEQPLSALGLDSLMAIELKNIVETKLRVAIPVARFMEGPSVVRLSEVVAELLERSEAAIPALETSSETSDARYPLSEGQKALWFLYKLAPQSTAYNICDAITAHGPLDLAALQGALQAIVDRHPSFRTTFHDEAGCPYQQVHRVWPVSPRVVDAAEWSEGELRRQIGIEVHTPFDLEVGPLLRVTMMRVSAERAVLVFAVHHLVADFWSMVGCTEEFRRLYSAARLGEPISLPPISHQYSDFLRWQREMLAGEEGTRQWRYWSEQLAGDLPVLQMPTDRPRPAMQTFRGALAFHKLDARLTAELKQLAEANGATLNMALLATYLVVLHRYAGQDDILVGLPTSGRTRAEFAAPVGYFVNPVVVRGTFTGDPTLIDFLAQVRERTLGGIEHQDYPLPLLVERLRPPRMPGRSTLFQALFVMQKAQILHEQGLTPFLMGQSGAKLPIADLVFESMTLEQWVAQFDLSLAASESDGCTSLGLQYSTDLFEKETAAQLLKSFEAVARSFVADPQQLVSRVRLLEPTEEARLLATTSATAPTAATSRSLAEVPVHQAVERQAARTPQRRAVATADGSLTYGDLNCRANQLAHRLQAGDVGRGDRVGICLPRSLDLPIALLGVLKTGAAYVPLDANYPEERLRRIADDAGLSHLVTIRACLSRLTTVSCPVLALDEEAESLAVESTENPGTTATLDDPIYVIYTSGSTGVPKGAEVYHRGFSNLLAWYSTELGIGPDDRSLVITSHGFDLTQKNLYAVLTAGGTLCLSATTVYDPEEIAAEIERYGATIVNCTPSNFYGVVDSVGDVDTKLDTLRYVVLGGESIDAARLKRWTDRPSCRAEIVNSYGPTECSDVVAFHRLGDLAQYAQRAVPIGRPVPGCRLYILDRHRRLVPQGVAGELFIGGICVGSGYVNDPQRTADRFPADPFGETTERMYGTGDLCRLQSDGTLEFLGRNDHQVKIRGYRIELGEIEAALAATGLVREAVVVVREASGGMKQLAAYVVPNDAVDEPNIGEHKSLAIPELLAQLGRTLPEYMIPSFVLPLDRLPLTPHGKVDRAALPDIDSGTERNRSAYEEPITESERIVADVWREVLNVSRVGRRDGFFELGGDSLSTIQVVSKLAARGKRCRAAVMFQCRTVAELAMAIDSTETVAVTTGQQTSDEVGLLPMQRWFFEEGFEEPNHFNQSLMVEVPPQLDVDALRAAVDAVAVNHPALRTSFARRDGMWRQRVVTLPICDDRLAVIDLSRVIEAERAAARTAAAAAAQASLKIENGILWKAVLFDYGPTEAGRLLLIAHHLAVDPYSWTILLPELATAYGQAASGLPIELPAAGVTPTAVAARDAGPDTPSALPNAARDHSPAIPLDYPSGIDTVESRRQIVMECPIARTNVAPTMLLAAVGAGLRNCFGLSKAIVDWESHGRDVDPELDLSRSVGWFVMWRRIVLPATGDSMSEQLAAIQRQLESPYDRLTEPGDVRINYLGALFATAQAERVFRISDDDRGPEQSAHTHRSHTLELDAALIDDCLRMTWTYGSNVHAAETIQRLAVECVESLTSLLQASAGDSAMSATR